MVSSTTSERAARLPQQRGAGARTCEVPCRSDRVRRVRPGRDRDRVRLPERNAPHGGGAARRVLPPARVGAGASTGLRRGLMRLTRTDARVGARRAADGRAAAGRPRGAGPARHGPRAGSDRAARNGRRDGSADGGQDGRRVTGCSGKLSGGTAEAPRILLRRRTEMHYLSLRVGPAQAPAPHPDRQTPTALASKRDSSTTSMT